MAEPRKLSFDALDSVIATASKVLDSTTTAAIRGGLAYDLRTRLAARGWVSPHALLSEALATREVPSPEVTSALNTVARDVDTAFHLRPGQWFLNAATRRRVFADRPQLLRQETVISRYLGDDVDPVRVAFQVAFGLARPAVSHLDVETLQALASVIGWLAPMVTQGPSSETIAAELAWREREENVRRLTMHPLVGESHQLTLAALTRGLTQPRLAGLEVYYVWGPGGSGKSTVLAFLEQQMRSGPSPTTMVRIDFDDPLVNAADQTSLDLTLLDQLSLLEPTNAQDLQQRGVALRRMRLSEHEVSPQQRRSDGLYKRAPNRDSDVSSLAAEAAGTEAASERDSLLFGLLAPYKTPGLGVPLVVVLDTVEIVMTQGATAIVGLSDWIQTLLSSKQAAQLRVIVAGRDPPESQGVSAFLDRLTLSSTVLDLPELNATEAVTLLRNRGVSDPQVAVAAAAAVPGNPLLLRMTAEALCEDGDMATVARAAHELRKVDPRSARSYLMRRVVAHVADPAARPYLLAAMFLPDVTRALLREVAMPSIDGFAPKSNVVDRTFKALKATRWLIASQFDDRALAFHHDIRTLVLRLLADAPEQAELGAQVRTRAINFHQARGTSRDRALEYYHRALRGDDPPRIRNRVAIVRNLGPLIEDLPPAWRDVLSGLETVFSANTQAELTRSDGAWRRYLEGDGSRDGEGDRLLKRDRAAEALKLYRERPTRPVGAPPTFVIRALADVGDWESGELEVDKVLDEAGTWLSNKRLSGASISRLYWITRFVLMRDNARVSEHHAAIIEACSERLNNPALASMPEIIAVAEAGLDRSLMPDRMRYARGWSESATRVYLVHSRRTRSAVEFKPHLDSLCVLQRDWIPRLRRKARGLIDADRLAWVQDRLDALDGAPLSVINATLRDLRQPVLVTWDGRDVEAGVLLLRGQTTEFLRPLRQALIELLADRSAAAEVEHLVRQLVGEMTIRPAELAPSELAGRLHHNRFAWSAAVVGFADRARLLPALCQSLANFAGDGPAARKASRVARAFLAWDRAICDGHPSDWRSVPKG